VGHGHDRFIGSIFKVFVAKGSSIKASSAQDKAAQMINMYLMKIISSET
jgi:hypothetical protein